MSASIFIARLLGPLLLILGIAVVSKTRMFRAVLRKFAQSQALLYLVGFFGLLAGLALVLTHNLWVRDWRLIITLIGWLTIIRALVTIFQHSGSLRSRKRSVGTSHGWSAQLLSICCLARSSPISGILPS